MLEDYKLGVSQEEFLLKQSKSEIKSYDNNEFADRMLQIWDRRKVNNAILIRLKKATEDSCQNITLDKVAIQKYKAIDSLANLSLDELIVLVSELRENRERIIETGLNGDCVDVLTNKAYMSINNLIDIIECEIQAKQSENDMEKEQ